MKNILKEIENKKRHKDAYGEQSYIDCPHCNNGRILYYWSQFAGVEWAKCSTKNCFNYNKKLTSKKKPKLLIRKKTKTIKNKQLTLL